jgi:hypothetical protein
VNSVAGDGSKLSAIADELLMRFTLLDPSDPEREFSMIIDVSKHEYTGASH